MRDISPNDPCPCTSGKKYKKCCRPYHHGVTIPSPTELLRARFAAFVLQDVDFIMNTTHPASPHIEKENRWRASLEAYTMRTYYQTLDILETGDDSITYTVGFWSMGLQEDEAYTTISHFKQHEGKWFYFEDSDVAEDKAEESSEA
jgi:SEC-C motif-containing protein